MILRRELGMFIDEPQAKTNPTEYFSKIASRIPFIIEVASPIHSSSNMISITLMETNFKVVNFNLKNLPAFKLHWVCVYVQTPYEQL